jgi:AraC family transcriptional regulator, ethanolamine operon transcriptional activator
MMLQREPINRHRIPAALPNRLSRESRCAARRGDDIDEFVSRVKGFRLKLLQIDQGAFRAVGFQAHLGDFLLGAARLERALVQTWTSPARSITIAVKASPAPAFWQGVSVGPADILIAGPETEIELVSRPRFGIASVSFPLGMFQRAAEELCCPSVLDRSNSSLVRLPAARAARELRRALRTLISDLRAHPCDARGPKWEQAKRTDLLFRTVHTVLTGVPFDPSKHNAERALILEQAMSAIRQRSADVLAVADLCRVTGASGRTLHYAFVERYGVPPARFMKAYRLNGARGDLGRIDSRESRISDVANRWGFWHLGQFAKDYRRWFGELPSETCRRNQVEK